jgi:hypothetical protein
MLNMTLRWTDLAGSLIAVLALWLVADGLFRRRK